MKGYGIIASQLVEKGARFDNIELSYEAKISPPNYIMQNKELLIEYLRDCSTKPTTIKMVVIGFVTIIIRID